MMEPFSSAFPTSLNSFGKPTPQIDINMNKLKHHAYLQSQTEGKTLRYS